MPLYDYRCSACGHEVEVMHPIGGSGPASCDVCGGAMRKALSPPAIHFKGSGWAKKDAAAGVRKATPAAEPSAKEPGGKDAKDAGSSSESRTKAADKPSSVSAGDKGS